MAELPTNYLDDILAASMGGKRIFKITHSDGTTEEVTIEDVSEYEQVGSNFGAGDINNTNAEVNKKFDSGDVVDPMETTEPGFAADAYQTKLQFDEQNKNISNIDVYVGSDKKLHFVDSEGADSVLPFSSGKDIVYIGVQATTYSSGWTEAQWFNGKTNEVGTTKVYMEQSPKSAIIVDKLQIEYNKIVALTDGIKYMKNKAGSTWTTLPKGASISATIGGTGTTYYLTFMCD